MIGRKSAIHLTGLLYGLFFGSIFSAVALQVFPHTHPVLKWLIIGMFVASFYFVGAWVAIRQELNKKIPTPSHELRRRKKDFYDWLDSQGRR
jgi:phosphotransferase system  glucose/maltose/N-acetylglucosamine-specific IIC component